MEGNVNIFKICCRISLRDGNLFLRNMPGEFSWGESEALRAGTIRKQG